MNFQICLAVALLALIGVQGQQVSPCPVQTNVRSRLHPNGNTGVNFEQGSNIYGKGEFDIVAATPTNGGGCNLIAIDLKDFLKTTGSNFCQNPSTTVPTGVPAKLQVQPTSSTTFTNEPNFQPGNSGGAGSSAAGRRLHAFMCGNRSPFASQISNGGFKMSSQYANTYYSILQGTPGSSVDGVTYFGIGVDGKCFINYINMDKFLFQNALSPANLCSIAGLSGKSG